MVTMVTMVTMVNKTNHYWGFWATLALGILVFLIFSVCQAMGLFTYIYTVDPQAIARLAQPDPTIGIGELLNQYSFSGDALAVAEIPAAILGVLMILWLSSRHTAVTANEYLTLNIPKLKTLLLFLGLMTLIIGLMELVNVWLDRPIPEFMSEVYVNTQNLPLLWIAVSLAAPFFEEFLFRGFLLEGFARTKLGVVGAVILTSAIWAIIHTQYGWFEITSIFLIGIILCIAKINSKSLYVPIAMHMLMNITASIGMELSQ